MPRARYLSLPVMATAALALAGCGGSSNVATSQSSSTTGTVATVTAPTTTTTLPPTTLPPSTQPPVIGTIPVAERSPAGTFGKAPTVIVPKTAPPVQEEKADLILGTGAPVETGDSVKVEYVLATYSSHKVVQSSWTSSPFTFTLGQTSLIPGWVDGMAGMRVGGRRELIIPPSLGYGAQSPGAGIAANDTLVFVIDLLSASKAS